MEKQKLPIRELLFITIGEAIISLIICGIYLLINKYSYKVALGALVGSVVTLVNFLVLSIMTNRVIDRFLKERGEGEMSDEDAAALAAKFQGQVQNQMKLSFIIRTAVMAVTLIIALVSGVFDVIATLIPLLMLRPIITVSQLFNRKAEK
jgi:hypothetical protein